MPHILSADDGQIELAEALRVAVACYMVDDSSCPLLGLVRK
jgi:hypothetical protein